MGRHNRLQLFSDHEGSPLLVPQGGGAFLGWGEVTWFCGRFFRGCGALEIFRTRFRSCWVAEWLGTCVCVCDQVYKFNIMIIQGGKYQGHDTTIMESTTQYHALTLISPSAFPVKRGWENWFSWHPNVTSTACSPSSPPPLPPLPQSHSNKRNAYF